MEKILFSSGKDDWETPPELFEELDAEFHFDLDPCAKPKTAKCKDFYTPEQDGLQQDWGGRRVFCNPPYSKKNRGNPGQEAWIKKCADEAKKPGTLVVMLIPARTDTRAFHEYIYNKAEIRFLPGRVHFYTDGKRGDAAPFPSMIVVFESKDDLDKILEEAGV